MKKLCHAILLFFVSGWQLCAQNTFQIDYQIVPTNTFPALNITGNIIQNPAGQYVLAGTGSAFLPLRGTVTTLDSVGNVVWSNSYVSSISTEFSDIKNTISGTAGYITAGASNTSSGLLMMRLDDNGNIVWANTYNFSGVNSSPEAYASKVLPASDGGFVVAGYIYQVDPDGAGPLPRQDSANCYCLKVNSAGTLLWAKIFFLSTAYINDHLFNDVTEVSNGYVFGGSMSEAHSDASGTYAMLLKTDFNGNLDWVQRWGPANTDAEVNALSTLSGGGSVLASGDDNGIAFYVNVNTTSGTLTSGYKYTGAGFIAPETMNTSGFPTNDGNYGFVGWYVNPLAFAFYGYVMKVNPANGSLIFGEEYKSNLLATILPIGRQVSDSGYIMTMVTQDTSMSIFGFDYHVIKTNSLGAMNSGSTGCPSATFNPAKGSYGPAFTVVVPPDTLFGSATASFTPVVTALAPKSVVDCISIICNPPPAPVAIATPSTICAPNSSVITGSGSGTGATYSVYDAATGGTLLGTSPLTVSPSSNTTYYVQASQGACTGATRTSVTVTVSLAIGSVGSISGSASSCEGSQSYSIGAVTNATSYTWSVSGGGTITSGQGTTGVMVNWTTAGGPYTVSVSASNTCGNSSNSVSVTVVTGPGAAAASALPNPACAGQNVVLSASSTGASTWAWSGPGAYSSGLQGPTITGIQPAQAGVYTLTTSNSCGTATASVNVSVNIAPASASASANPNPACSGQNVVLTGTATGATSFSWTGPNNYTSNVSSPSINSIQFNQGGLYILIASNSCGNDTASVLEMVNTAPSAVSATASPNPVCLGTTVNLTGLATGATSWGWAGPDNFSANTENTSVAGFQNVNTGTYTLSATNACGTASANVIVTDDSVPGGVSASANSTLVCYGSTISFTGTASGATSYSWTGPNGFSSTVLNPNLSNTTLADSGTYQLTATNSCGSKSSTVLVNVDTLIQNLSATASPSDTLCAGSTISLAGTGINVNTWSWSGPGAYSSGLQSPTITNATPANSGTYIVTASNACGSAADSVRVFIESSTLTLTATSSIPNDTACFGQTIDLFATGSVFNIYSWTGPLGFSSSLQDPVISNATTGQSGLYSVTGTSFCGSKIATLLIQIDALIQNLNISVSPGDTVCTRVNVSLNGSGAGVQNWSWTGPNGFASTLPDLTISNITQADSGAYLLTASNACGLQRDTVLIDVQNDNLGITPIASVDSACSGAQISLSGTGNVFSSYQWTGPDGFIAKHLDTTLTNVSTAQSGYYNLTGTGACGIYANEVNVTIDSLPSGLNLSTSATGNATCQGQNIIVTATSSSATTWSWTGPSGFTANTASFTLQDIQPSQQGLYYVTATNYCGTSVDTIRVTVYATPDTITVSASSDSICTGSSVNLTASSGLTNIVWGGGQRGDSITVSLLGIYFYSGTNANGCPVRSDTITVHTAVPTVLDLFGSNPTAICQGQQVVTLHASSDPSVVVTWYPGGVVTDSLRITTWGEYTAVGEKNGCTVADSVFVALGTLPTVSFADTNLSSCCTDVQATPVAGGIIAAYNWSDSSTQSSDLLTRSGVYSVTVTTGRGCTASAGVNFNKICISAQATATPDSIYAGHSSQLNATTGITGNLVYQWQPEDSLPFSAISNPLVSPVQSTTYTVVIRDTSNGCTDSASVLVTVLYAANFGIPNVFAPNGGGINSRWFVINQGGLVTVDDIKVFDRWGILVFSSEREGTIEWDGYYRGKLQPIDNYVYMIKLKINATGEEQSLSGNLALIW